MRKWWPYRSATADISGDTNWQSTPSPSHSIWDKLQSICPEHKLPTGPSFRWVGELISISRWKIFICPNARCYCELIEKLISCHNASLIKSDVTSCDNVLVFQKRCYAIFTLDRTQDSKREASSLWRFKNYTPSKDLVRKVAWDLKQEPRAQETWCSLSYSSSLQARQSLDPSLHRLSRCEMSARWAHFPLYEIPPPTPREVMWG